MIQFRCWFCNRAYWCPDDRAGQRFACRCSRQARVPRRSGGSSKIWSPLDWLVESLVYGGTGALLGFLLAIAIFARLPVFRRPSEAVAALTLFGLVAGTLFGERGINWIGGKLRDRTNR